MKQDEYSTIRPTLKRWSKRNPTVEPRWARPKTDHQAPTSFVKRFKPESSLSLRPDPPARVIYVQVIRYTHASV